MIACSRSLLRVDSVLKFVNCYVISKPVDCFQGRCSYHGLTFNRRIGGIKNIFSVHAMGGNRKQKAVAHIWRPVSTQATSEDVTIESEDGGKVQAVRCSTSGSVSNAQEVLKVSEVVTEIADSTVSVTVLEDNVEDEALELQPDLSAEKHSRCLKVGSSLFRFIVGKGGSTQREIEEKMRVKITIPSSKMEEDIVIDGASIDSVTRASEKIQAILDEAVKSPNLEYSHFVSLPLAIYPELVDKLVNFQNSILGSSDASLEEVLESGSGENTSDKEDKDQNKGHSIAVDLKVEDDKRIKVDLTSIPLISYAPKKSKSPTLSDLGIDKSIFIKPKTFHLTVLMLKLWNMERVNAASEVLKSISSKVMEALDNRPVSVRLKGLDCMRGSLAKARVLYATVEEIGSEGRLSRACQVITDAFVEAGLVLEKDAKQKLKLHATVMNAKHRKGKKRRRNDSFDARGIFEKHGSEEWGDYLIREAHLSQRFVYDENGYYHCCASIPFPESMQID